MIELIKHPCKTFTRCIETIYFCSGKAYAICDGDKIIKWLFFVTKNGKYERF